MPGKGQSLLGPMPGVGGMTNAPGMNPLIGGSGGGLLGPGGITSGGGGGGLLGPGGSTSLLGPANMGAGPANMGATQGGAGLLGSAGIGPGQGGAGLLGPGGGGVGPGGPGLLGQGTMGGGSSGGGGLLGPGGMGGEGGKGSSLLGDAPNKMGGGGGAGGKMQSLMGPGPGSGKTANANNTAIMQAMGLNMGGNSANNLGQTLLGQISQGLVHQIGQNLMYQLSVNQNSNNQSGGVGGSGKGLLGDVPQSQGSGTGPVSTRGKAGGKSSLLGEPPSTYKSTQANSNTTPLDQGSWKSGDNR